MVRWTGIPGETERFTMDTTRTPAPTNTERLLRRDEAAAYVVDTFGIPCSPKTLAKLAVIGGGPAFRKAGRTPLYAPTALRDWALAKLGPVIRSTSELTTEAA